MRKAASVFVLTLALTLTILVSHQSPHVAQAQGSGTGRRQARIVVDCEESLRLAGDPKAEIWSDSLTTTTLHVEIVGDVPDESFLRPTGASPGPTPHETVWPSRGSLGEFKILSCTGLAEHAGHEEHHYLDWSGTSFDLPKKWTEDVRGAKSLACSDGQWTLRFSSDEGLQEFSYYVAAIPTTSKTTNPADNRPRTGTASIDAGIRFPQGGDTEWVLKRSFDSTGMQASGTYDRSSSGPTAVYHKSVRVTVDLDSAEYECVLTPPEEYQSWQPMGALSEEDAGSWLQFKGEIRCKRGTPARDRTIWFRARVSSSTQPGVCLNFPVGGAKSADLIIEREGTSPELELKSSEGTGADDAWTTATGNLKVGQKFTVMIASRDYGAFGKITFASDAEVRVEGFDKRDGVLDLPFDENHNHIADSWDEAYAGKDSTPSLDVDDVPMGNGKPGDGLSLYEEYRGFMLEGQHERTDPLLKDVFIYDETGYGWGDFMQSRLAPHLVSSDEYGEEGDAPNRAVINPNRGFATNGPQYVLRLVDVRLDGNLGESLGLGPPRAVVSTRIDVAKCLEDDKDALRRVIAHELAHGCNVDHHGGSDYPVFKIRVWQQDRGEWSPEMVLLDDGGRLIWTQRGDRMPEPLWVAAQGGQESGVENCIMRYRGRLLYESPGGGIGWKRGGAVKRGTWYAPYEPSGHIFCDNRTGTGVNAANRPGGPKAGDATKGNCLGQFCLKDPCDQPGK